MKIHGFSTNMYGWMERWKRDGKIPNWNEIFKACAEAGLDAVEIDATPEKLELARSYGLQVSATYVGLPLHGPYENIEVDRQIMPFAERAAAAGASDFLINADPFDWKNRVPKTEDDQKRQGENLMRIAGLLQPYGLRLCMHNHAADRANAEGDLHSVTEFADDTVGLCLDIGWAHSAGCDPIEWVKAHPERVWAFHFRNQFGTVPAEDLIEGEIDIPKLLNLPELANYEGWLSLELWHPETMEPERSMTEDCRLSVQYLKKLIKQG